jgi:hypothetical protein
MRAEHAKVQKSKLLEHKAYEEEKTEASTEQLQS